VWVEHQMEEGGPRSVESEAETAAKEGTAAAKGNWSGGGSGNRGRKDGRVGAGVARLGTDAVIHRKEAGLAAPARPRRRR